ncbi:hypothetical protein BGW36DRAFT_421267 [Talaromyces proteolyticus]|uniref:Ketosynthase family 3 (KS3) domain-containing protein n=1 Tax=Talaromyces proteolyticus TaxID=1131652 RepID=A0AAD4KE44_9EURO|nr:uncharacterized protein BGW36DRAFT_421267 [Talaromyces proteolyticus]KAH8688610.1 hypothetical protein BGW36DRAFT_421267 [Talaromyces proteolyticus]
MMPIKNEPIAIIGTGCRFPGESTSPSKLWDLLKNPRDVLSIIPIDRFNPEGFYHVDGQHHATGNVKQSYLLSEDLRCFDAQFFNIKPIEAHSVDPQQRLLLETVYEAIDSAGLRLEQMDGTDTAVYVGLMCEDYSLHLRRDPNTVPTYLATGTARSIVSNRISYFFNWHGPSITIDTACSSSLVAVHEAVRSLRAGDCRVAIAAGANLIIAPEQYIAESKLNMLSPHSRSRMWDKDADGYARGDGVAAIVLKRLDAAIEDGDNIECIVRETGVNQDGRTNGITVPNAQAQISLIQETYRKAGLDPLSQTDRCQFFEAHGTGTPTGDPIEAEAIHKSFFSATSADDEKLFVGSIKTVCGHTEGTAGIAGIIKSTLALQHGIIPPNMLLTELHPNVKPFSDHLEIPMEPVPWPSADPVQPRRASVNSFGFGGTNAHAILESYESVLATGISSPVATPFTFSAASERSLSALISSYSTWLRSQNGSSTHLRNLSYTLHSRKSSLAVKAAFSATSIESLCLKLDQKNFTMKDVNGNGVGVRSSKSPPRILAIFTGQGAQWAGMAKDLILSSEFVKDRIESFEQILASLPDGDRPNWSITDAILATAEKSQLNLAEKSQPVCTVVQVILVDLLRSAGIPFHAVVGHSSGEIGAAYAAGFLSAEDAIKIAYYRGFHAKLAGASNGRPGAMMAVGTTFEDAEEMCLLEDYEGRLCVAASNSSASVTLSGDADAIEATKAIFEDEKKFARILKVDTAYHSHHMTACSEPYMKSLQECDIKPSPGYSCRWFSSVQNGNPIEDASGLDASYWRDNMVYPVLFREALERALADEGSFDLVIEVGPHPALQGPAQQTFQDALGKQLPYSGLLRRGTNDLEAISDALGFVWMHHGHQAVDFSGYEALLFGPKLQRPALLKNLPSYPWDHDRKFWFETRMSRMHRIRSEPIHELLGTREFDSAEELRWQLLWLYGHQLQGQILFPAAAYASTAIEAAQILSQDQEIIVIEPITFDDEESSVEILIVLSNSPESDTLTLTVGAPNLLDVPTDVFYNFLAKVGLGYTGLFRDKSGHGSRLLSSFLAMCHPGDGTIRGLHVPKRIHRIRKLADGSIGLTPKLHADNTRQHALIQIEGLEISPLASTATESYRHIFSTIEWNLASPNGEIAAAVYYLLNLTKRLLNFADYVISGEWLLMENFKDDNVIQNLPGAVHGETSMLEHMMEDGSPLGMMDSSGYMANMVQQIIGAGTGGMTTHIFDRVDAFHSYTYTDISSGFFEQAQQKFAKWPNHSSRLTFQSLDIEKDIESQGFTPHSYDLVVAGAVLHATASLDNTLENVHRLLKPGGYLLMLEPTRIEEGSLRLGFVFGALPGWWLGVNDDRLLSPCITSQEWDPILKTAGFTGVDTVTPTVNLLVNPSYVIAAQALDDRVATLRHPLESSPKMLNDTLIILGGVSGQLKSLALSLIALLNPWYDSVVHCTSVEELAQHDLTSRRHLLSITDLDTPIFQSLSDAKVQSIKGLFEKTSIALWVTQGCRAASPYSNMSVGFGRTLVHEMSHLRLQYWDLEPAKAPNSEALATAFLRLRIMNEWAANPEVPLLYSIEPEMSHQNGNAVIPRLRHMQTANDRSVSTPIALRSSTSGYSLVEILGQHHLNQPRSVNLVCIQVSHSTLMSIRLPTGSFFLVIGTLESSNMKVIALADKQASLVHVHPKLYCPINVASGTEGSLLLLMIGEFIIHILSRNNGKLAILHEPEPALAVACSQSASNLGMRLTFTSSVRPTDGEWLHLHPFICDRDLRRDLPSEASCVVDFTSPDDSSDLFDRITAVMPTTCRFLKSANHIFDVNATLQDGTELELANLLQIVTLRATSATLLRAPPVRSVTLSQLPETSAAAYPPTTVIDWVSTPKIPVKVDRIDNAIIFAPDKTYILFGLTSDLAQSLAQWMVQHGARYIVLTSRNPKIDPTWLARMRAMRATVRVYANDITCRPALETLCQEISRTLPEIKGVVHGAMVLIDTVVANLTMELVEEQMKPKVDGSRFLDEIFRDQNLDFFILLSSLMAVWGNHGQSVYTAANLFMTALAEQRRQRGQAASILYMGTLIGSGYLAHKASRAAVEWQEKVGNQPISDRDIHVAFAEAILAGIPESTAGVEVIVGEREVEMKPGSQSQWLENPKFGHYTKRQQRVEVYNGVGNATISTRDKLQEATSTEEAHDILKDAFTSKLATMLQLDDGESGREQLVHLGAYELGIDSLVAVALRSWFFAELDIDMPVFRILGGATMAGLLTSALEKLPPDMAPNLARQPVQIPDTVKLENS